MSVNRHRPVLAHGVDQILNLPPVAFEADRTGLTRAGAHLGIDFLGANSVIAGPRLAKIPVRNVIVLEHRRSFLAADLDAALPPRPQSGAGLDGAERAIG